jgi:hypothetical protein
MASVTSNNNINIDMATALELPLGVENEAKFVALRNLHLKKIKQLMNSLDQKDRDIAKLKILNKDNRRTQMIQALRNKIRDMELINDVIKEELAKKSERSIEEINQLIIRKTLGGPKRFRPLTREELENKIFELEKKLTKSTTGRASDNQYQEQEQKLKGDAAASQSKPPLNRPSTGAKGTSSNYADENNNNNELLDSYALFDEVQTLKSNLLAKDNTISSLRDEIIRLRARNSELVTFEEEIEFYERQCDELKECNEILSKNLEETTTKLAHSLEVSTKLKSDTSLKQESEKTELVTLRTQCEKLLKQNTILVKNLQDAEDTLGKYEEDSLMKNEKDSNLDQALQSRDSKLKSLEEKLNRNEEKTKQFEQRCLQLENENKQISVLKEQLREKNIEIKDVKRNLQEREKIMNLKNSTSRGSLDNLHIAEEKEKELHSSPAK